MGVSIAFQLPSGLYIGGLMGLQRQVCANLIQIAWSLFRGVGAVLVLWLLSPSIVAFASWQVVSNVLYWVLARHSLWRTLPSANENRQPRFEWVLLQSNGRYAASIAGMAVLSTVLVQADKIIVSRLESLEQLGYYTLAVALASAPLMVASPIASAVSPRLTALVALGDREGLSRLCGRAVELVGVVVVPFSLALACFGREVVWVWTGSSAAAALSGPVGAVLMGGQLLQAVTLVPYYIAVAHGQMGLNIRIGIASILLAVPLLLILVTRHGILGAALSWSILNLAVVPFYMVLLHRRFLPNELRRWFTHGIARPFVFGAPCVVVARLLAPAMPSRPLAFLLIVVVCGVSVLLAIATSADLRRPLLDRLGERIRIPKTFRRAASRLLTRVHDDNMLNLRRLVVTPYRMTQTHGPWFPLEFAFRLLRHKYLTHRVRSCYFGGSQRHLTVRAANNEVGLLRDTVSFGLSEISRVKIEYAGRFSNRRDLRILVNEPPYGGAAYFYSSDIVQCLDHMGVRVRLVKSDREDVLNVLAQFRPSVFITGDWPWGAAVSDGWARALREYKAAHGLARLYLPHYPSPLRVRRLSGGALGRLALHKEGFLADAFVGYFEEAFWDVFCEEWKSTGLSYYSVPFAANPCRHYPIMTKELLDWGIATVNGDLGERALLTFRYLKRIMSKYNGVIAGNNWGPGIEPIAPDRVSQFFCRVRISPNIAPASNVEVPLDCGAKVHELAAMGVFQLATQTQALKKYYSSEEIVTFRTPPEFDSLFEYYVNNPRARQEQVRRAMARTLSENTYFHRIEKLIGVLDQRPELF